MFIDVEHAHRIEQAEARLTTLFATAAGAADLRTIAGGVSAVVRPGSPINKIIGVGFEELDLDALEAAEAAWRAIGEPARIEIATLAEPAVLAQLSARGYHLAGFENVLGCPLATHVAAPTGVAIEEVDDTSAEWAHALVEGFAAPDGTGATADEHSRAAVEEVMRDFLLAPQIRRYLARVDGAIAGAGGVHVDGTIAQLCGAATMPQHRRRGVQRALLDARLADVRAAGCELALVTTSPGTQSQANVMRRGFALLYTRAILLRTWT